jgi:hypothetical protein
MLDINQTFFNYHFLDQVLNAAEADLFKKHYATVKDVVDSEIRYHFTSKKIKIADTIEFLQLLELHKVISGTKTGLSLLSWQDIIENATGITPTTCEIRYKFDPATMVTKPEIIKLYECIKGKEILCQRFSHLFRPNQNGYRSLVDDSWDHDAGHLSLSKSSFRTLAFGKPYVGVRSAYYDPDGSTRQVVTFTGLEYSVRNLETAIKAALENPILTSLGFSLI